MPTQFKDYKDLIKNYHLYASKTSEERNQVRDFVIPLMMDVDSKIDYHQKYNYEIISELISEFHENIIEPISKNEDYSEKSLQYTYFIVDHLLFTPVIMNLNKIDQSIPNIADICSKYWNPFVVLHELAVLCWYDGTLPVEQILDRLSKYELNQTELYHILGEVSLLYPKESIELQANNQLLDEYYNVRFVKKLRNSRSRKLNKDVEISLTLDEVNELIDQIK